MNDLTLVRADELVPRGTDTPPFVLVTGGKGGVGKSTIALNTSLELARNGRRVLLVDLDLGLANLSVLLRLTPARNVEDFFAGRARLEDVIVRAPRGLHVLPGGSGTPDMARPDADRRRRLFAALLELGERYDLVVGDSAAGIGPEVLAWATVAHKVLVVTTPEPTALTDAYGLIKALDRFALESGAEVPTPDLFVNQAAGIDEAERTARQLACVTERFLARAPRLVGWLPRAASISQSVRDQRPFVLMDRATGSSELERGCVSRLARRLDRLIVPRVPRLGLGIGVPTAEPSAL